MRLSHRRQTRDTAEMYEMKGIRMHGLIFVSKYAKKLARNHSFVYKPNFKLLHFFGSLFSCCVRSISVAPATGRLQTG